MSGKKREKAGKKEQVSKEENERLPQEIRNVYARLQKPDNPGAPRMRRDGVRQG